jgi:hypothetical protein
MLLAGRRTHKNKHDAWCMKNKHFWVWGGFYGFILWEVKIFMCMDYGSNISEDKRSEIYGDDTFIDFIFCGSDSGCLSTDCFGCAIFRNQLSHCSNR